jgi:hypothetical protein
MVAGILQRAPYAGDAKLAATALIHVASGMAATHFDTPALGLGISQRSFNFLVRMRPAYHPWRPWMDSKMIIAN